MKKIRPCLVVSPDVMNQHLRTVLVAPMTTAQRPYPTRINASFQNKRGQVALDQIRVVDRSRMIKKLGVVSDKLAGSVSALLVEMFQRA
jgi:mRNA interferase MazF